MLTIEEQRNKAIAEEIQKMAGIEPDTPTIINTETVKSQEKNRQVDLLSMDLELYLTTFLHPCIIENRASFSLNRDTLDLLRHILHDLRSKTTLSAYIENILKEHISRHKEIISKGIEKNRRKSLIP